MKKLTDKNTHVTASFQRSCLALLIGSAAWLAASPVVAQTTPAAKPTICDRACWIARNGTCTTTMSSLNRAIIHNTGASAHSNTSGLADSKAWMRSIQNHQMDNNGWCDTGYHFVVDKFGNIFEARKNSISGLPRGAHDGCNSNSFGFCLMGNFDTQSVPTAGLNGMYDVMAWRMPSGWSPYGSGTYCSKTIGHVDGHNKVKATTCPGANFVSLIGSNYNGGTVRTAIATRRTPASAVIVDNNQSGFSASSSWILASSSTDKYGADYRYRSTQPVSDVAVWTASLPSTKSYTVSAWWPQGSNRSSTAAYHIVHASGTTVVTVNQQTNGGQWNTLGSWNMNAGSNEVRLSCWTTTGYVVIADAIRWQ